MSRKRTKTMRDAHAGAGVGAGVGAGDGEAVRGDADYIEEKQTPTSQKSKEGKGGKPTSNSCPRTRNA